MPRWHQNFWNVWSRYTVQRWPEFFASDCIFKGGALQREAHSDVHVLCGSPIYYFVFGQPCIVALIRWTESKKPPCHVLSEIQWTMWRAIIFQWNAFKSWVFSCTVVYRGVYVHIQLYMSHGSVQTCLGMRQPHNCFSIALPFTNSLSFRRISFFKKLSVITEPILINVDSHLIYSFFPFSNSQDVED